MGPPPPGAAEAIGFLGTGIDDAGTAQALGVDAHRTTGTGGVAAFMATITARQDVAFKHHVRGFDEHHTTGVSIVAIARTATTGTGHGRIVDAVVDLAAHPTIPRATPSTVAAARVGSGFRNVFGRVAVGMLGAAGGITRSRGVDGSAGLQGEGFADLEAEGIHTRSRGDGHTGLDHQGRGL